MNKVIYIIALFLTSFASYAQGACAAVIPDEGSKYAYKKYNDKCEGLIASTVSVGNAILEVRSFTDKFENYDIHSVKNLVISNPSLKYISNINVIAESIDAELLYRMDTLMNKKYEWDMRDVISPVGIEKEKIGVVASADVKLQDHSVKLLIPINISTESSADKSKNLELILWPWVDMKSISYSVALPENDNGKLKYIIKDKKIDEDYFGYEEPVKIYLRRYNKKGLHYVRISYEAEDGYVGSIQFWYEDS